MVRKYYQTLFVILLTVPAVSLSQGFSYLWYWFDDGEGEFEFPLSDSCPNGTPLPDGTIVQIFWDSDGDGPDETDSLPTLCDDPPTCEGGPWGTVNMNQFVLNGGQWLLGEGYFAMEQGFESAGGHEEPWIFYLRICLPNLMWESTPVNLHHFPPDSFTFNCSSVPCPGNCHAPPAPDNVSATDSLCDGVLITWTYPDTVEGLDRFLIFRSGSLIETITDTSQRSYFYADAPFGSANYGVKARRNCGGGDLFYSLLIQDVGNHRRPAPAAEDITASDTLMNQVQITWTYSTNLGLSYWRVERDGDSLGTVPSGGNPGQRSFVDTNPLETVHFYDVLGFSTFCGFTASTGGDSGQALPDAAEEALVPAITTYALYPAFPNPFNAETEIRFDLPQPCRVQLRVFDINGREVAELVNDALPIGTHAINYSAKDLPSGVYFVRMNAERFAQTQKLLLLK